MKLFFVATSFHHLNILVERNVNNVLVSYYFLMKDKRLLSAVNSLADKKEFIIDSGAFTAWTQGIEISLDDYISFINMNKSKFNHFVNLDVIGDAETTERNMQVIMKRTGIEPITVYHGGEDLIYLKHMVKNYEYIGLSSNAKWPAEKQSNWLKVINGIFPFTKHKFHCFGFVPLREKFIHTLYSGDSATWARLAGFGNIICPLTLKTLRISVDASHQNSAHFFNLSREHKKMLLAYAKKRGFTLDQLVSQPLSRAAFNVEVMKDVFEKGELKEPEIYQQQLFNILHEGEKSDEEEIVFLKEGRKKWQQEKLF